MGEIERGWIFFFAFLIMKEGRNKKDLTEIGLMEKKSGYFRKGLEFMGFIDLKVMKNTKKKKKKMRNKIKEKKKERITKEREKGI